MPITFDKAKLIETAKKAIAVHETADAEYRAAIDAYIVAHSPESKRENIVRLRNALSAFIKTGRAPTREDAQAFRRAAGEDYITNLYDRPCEEREARNNTDTPTGWMQASRVASYRGLISMLEADSETTITAAQLKLFGYTNLEALFRVAATVPQAVI